MKPIVTVLLAVAAFAAALYANIAFAATPEWMCDPLEGRIRQVSCTFNYDEDSAPSVNRGTIHGFLHPPYCPEPDLTAEQVSAQCPAMQGNSDWCRPEPGSVDASANGLTFNYTSTADTFPRYLVALTTLVTGGGRSLQVASSCFTIDPVNGRAPGSTQVVTPGERSNVWRVPHFFAVESRSTHSFVRIVNLSATNSIFTVKAYDETGSARFSPLRIRVNAERAVAFNSRDLELNGEDKFLDGEFVEDGRGDWRLDITPSTSTPIDDTQYYVGAYARTEGNFLTNMGEYARTIPNGDDLVRPNLYVLPSFNPARNRTKVSHLRLSNLGDAASGNFALVAISELGLFRAARLPEIEAGATRMWSAVEVEELLSPGGGSIGGKQTFIIGGPEALVTHLMQSKDLGDGTAGFWTNLTAVTNSAGAIGAEEARRLWAKGLATGL